MELSVHDRAVATSIRLQALLQASRARAAGPVLPVVSPERLEWLRGIQRRSELARDVPKAETKMRRDGTAGTALHGPAAPLMPGTGGPWTD